MQKAVSSLNPPGYCRLLTPNADIDIDAEFFDGDIAGEGGFGFADLEEGAAAHAVGKAVSHARLERPARALARNHVFLAVAADAFVDGAVHVERHRKIDGVSEWIFEEWQFQSAALADATGVCAAASAKGLGSEKSSSARVRVEIHNVAAARPQQEMSPMKRNKVRSSLKPLGGIAFVAE